jgi:hypothetical protein
MVYKKLRVYWIIIKKLAIYQWAILMRNIVAIDDFFLYNFFDKLGNSKFFY